MDGETRETRPQEERASEWLKQLNEKIGELDPQRIPSTLSEQLVHAWYIELAKKGQSSAVLRKPDLNFDAAFFFPEPWGGVVIVDGKQLGDDNVEREGKRIIVTDVESKRFIGYGGLVLNEEGGADVTFRIFSDFRSKELSSREIFTSAMAAGLATLSETPDTLVVPTHQQMARKDLGERQTSAPLFYRRMGFGNENDPTITEGAKLTEEELYELGRNEARLEVANSTHEAIAAKVSELEDSGVPELNPSDSDSLFLKEVIAKATRQENAPSASDRAAKLRKLAERLGQRD